VIVALPLAIFPFVGSALLLILCARAVWVVIYKEKINSIARKKIYFIFFPLKIRQQYLLDHINVIKVVD
jgi:hypothetical protein